MATNRQKLPELLRKREPLTPSEKRAINDRMKELGGKSKPAVLKKGKK